MTYFDNVNPHLLEVVNPQARRICEFGCGGGALAREIRKTHPDVHYTGLELMPEPLERACEFLDVAIECDLNQPDFWAPGNPVLKDLPPESFDHVIFGDVLEHLYSPERAVQEAARTLVRGGSLLACIPNVQHWSVFVQLASGTWPRQDAGLFDRTHLRWFALKDMVQLLEDAGLIVEQVIPRIFDQEQGLSVMEFLEPLAIYLGQDPGVLVQRGLPLQYVLVGRKP